MAKNHGLFYKLGHSPNHKLHFKDHQKWYRSFVSCVWRSEQRASNKAISVWESICA